MRALGVAWMMTSAGTSVALVGILPAQAQASQLLDPVVVTATRRAQTVDETLSSVTVIDRAEIDRLQPQSFADLLRSRAGIDIAQNGAFGQISQVFVRGIGARGVLVLIDGVRVGAATDGRPSWEFLPVSEIERVEIVRGPRSSLYGADAAGGIIQVFTRKGDGPTNLRGHIGGGSFHTREGGLGISGSASDTRYSVSISGHRSAGIDVLTGRGDDRADGVTSNSLSAHLDHPLNERVNLSGTLLYSEGDADFDSFSSARQWNDFRLASANLTTDIHFSDYWVTRLQIGQSRDDRVQRQDPPGTPRVIKTKRDYLAWVNDMEIAPDLELTLGFDYQLESVEASQSYAQTSRYTRGYFGQLQTRLERQEVIGSLRHDDNEIHGGKTTGQLSWGYKIADGWRIRGSYGLAFTAPTFLDALYPEETYPRFGGGNETYSGNPGLKPEELKAYEVALQFRTQRASTQAAFFHNDITNLIDGYVCSNPDGAGNRTCTAENINSARVRGVELEGVLFLNSWTAKGTLTHLDHLNQANGNELARRPNTTARFDLDHSIGSWSYGGTVTAQGRSFNDANNDERISGHTLLDLRASYSFARHWKLRARVANALDRKYATTLDFGGSPPYNQPGRAFYVSLHYHQ
jgi:vitamin B12 transporter